MSKFDRLEHLLAAYHQLQYHHNTALAQRLRDVQTWQKQRFQRSHQDLFNRPDCELITQYFLNRLYGSDDFDMLAEQVKRMLDAVHKVERIIPKKAVYTGTLAVELGLFSTELDEGVALYLLNHYDCSQPLNDQMMRDCYLALNQEQQRYQQIDLLDELSHYLDRYLKSMMIYTAYRLAKGSAHRHGMGHMYEFIGEGFSAIKPIDSAEAFIKQFTDKERKIIQAVHQGHPAPFHL